MSTESLRKHLRAHFESSREWLNQLINSLKEEELTVQVDELRGPLIWDLGHIAWFEDLWIARNAFGLKPLRSEVDIYYDNERNHKRLRQTMPILQDGALYDYMRTIRQNTLLYLVNCDFDPGNKLLKNGFVFYLALHHELQHHEIMIITLQQLLTHSIAPMDASPIEQSDRKGYEDFQPGATVEIPAGSFVLGAAHEDFAYDNERPAHEIDVPAFHIDRFLTTNADYIEFIEAGGYEKKGYWSDAGWQWIKANQIVAPEYWRFDPNEGWVRKGFGGAIRPIVPDEPVINVSAYEADAYALFRGKRLPTEVEWEKAASTDPGGHETRLDPWGNPEPTGLHAPLACRHWGPCPVWRYPEGESAYGVRQLMGNAFEWTASPFTPYRSFKAFPYQEYSQIFMNPHFRVLRGASWATHPLSARKTFRNFYLPHHRNVIAGIRLAH